MSRRRGKSKEWTRQDFSLFDFSLLMPQDDDDMSERAFLFPIQARKLAFLETRLTREGNERLIFSLLNEWVCIIPDSSFDYECLSVSPQENTIIPYLYPKLKAYLCVWICLPGTVVWTLHYLLPLEKVNFLFLPSLIQFVSHIPLMERPEGKWDEKENEKEILWKCVSSLPSRKSRQRSQYATMERSLFLFECSLEEFIFASFSSILSQHESDAFDILSPRHESLPRF
jgi:hypothetical protein